MNNNLTKIVMTSRALLALSTLLTLIFNDISKLIPKYNIERLSENAHGIENINIFFMFDNIYVPYFFSIFILILVIIGFFPRYVCLFHTIVTYSVFYSLLVQEGGDQINCILTLLLVPFCLINNKINGWHFIYVLNNNNIFSKFVYYSFLAIKIQMSLLYLNAGISKIFQAEWFNGTAVYYWFNNSVFGAPHFIRDSMGFLFTNSITVSLINWSVIILEVFLFTAIFLNQRYKHILLILALFFHFSIFIIHGLPTFMLSMSAGLILYLFDFNNSIKNNFESSIKEIKSLLKYAI